MNDVRHTFHSEVADSEVAIVGASAAGLYTACLLARNGVAVRVYERAEELDPLRRTLIVTSRMRDLLGPEGDRAVLNEINRFELFADGRIANVPLRRPDLIIERAEVIRTMADAAREAGAELVTGHEFVELAPVGRDDGGGERALRLRLEGPEGETEARADVVVGADGAFSRVAASAGWPQQPTLPLMQAIVRKPDDVATDTSVVWFLPEETPYFFWMIPDSPDVAALGIIGEDGTRTREAMERFLDDKGYDVLDYQGARIPMYARWIPVHRKVGAGDVYLAGDAAGQVKVTTVGGIVTGLRGALGVAEAVLNGGPDRSPELRSLRAELDFHLWIRQAMHHFDEDDYRQLLDFVGGPVRKTLAAITRDETPRMLWDIFRRQPGIILFGLRHLATNGAFPPGKLLPAETG